MGLTGFDEVVNTELENRHVIDVKRQKLINANDDIFLAAA